MSCLASSVFLILLYFMVANFVDISFVWSLIVSICGSFWISYPLVYFKAGPGFQLVLKWLFFSGMFSLFGEILFSVKCGFFMENLLLGWKKINWKKSLLVLSLSLLLLKLYLNRTKYTVRDWSKKNLGEFSQPAKKIEKLFCNYRFTENFNYTCCYSGK
jgi:hypothetical protein